MSVLLVNLLLGTTVGTLARRPAWQTLQSMQMRMHCCALWIVGVVARVARLKELDLCAVCYGKLSEFLLCTGRQCFSWRAFRHSRL
jgi:hypothetical protein